MTITKALAANGLTDEFRTIATAQTPTSAVIAWIQSREELAGIKLPLRMDAVRKPLGCPAQHGGPRPVSKRAASDCIVRHRKGAA